MAKRIVVCVSGGTVQEIYADEEVEVVVVDHDEYKENPYMVRDVRDRRQDHMTDGLSPIDWGLDNPSEQDINNTLQWAGLSRS